MKIDNPVIPDDIRIKTVPKRKKPFPKKFERRRWSENEIVTIVVKNLKENQALRKAIKEVT